MTCIRFSSVWLLLSVMTLPACNKHKDDHPSPGYYQYNNPKPPAQVYISSVVATPTSSESITLTNNSGATADISGWTLGDLNDPTAYSIPANTVLSAGQTITFTHTQLGFQINDSGETLYLKNAGVTVYYWYN